MPIREYIAPEITLLCVYAEQGFAASQNSTGIDIGIGGWEEENYDTDIK